MPAKYTATYKTGVVSGTTFGTAEGSVLPTISGYDYDMYFYDTVPRYFMSNGQFTLRSRSTAPSGDYLQSTTLSGKEYAWNGTSWVFVQNEPVGGAFPLQPGFRIASTNSYTDLDDVHNSEIIFATAYLGSNIAANPFPPLLGWKRVNKLPL